MSLASDWLELVIPRYLRLRTQTLGAGRASARPRGQMRVASQKWRHRAAVSQLQNFALRPPFGDQLDDLSDIQLRAFFALLVAHL